MTVLGRVIPTAWGHLNRPTPGNSTMSIGDWALEEGPVSRLPTNAQCPITNALDHGAIRRTAFMSRSRPGQSVTVAGDLPSLMAASRWPRMFFAAMQ